MKYQYTLLNWRWWLIMPYMVALIPVSILFQLVVWAIDISTYCTDSLWHVRYFLMYDFTEIITKPLYWAKKERPTP